MTWKNNVTVKIVHTCGVQTGEAVLLHISSTTYQFALQGLQKSIKHMYHALKEIYVVGINYEMFENTGDMCYRFYNNSDMHASDLKL